MNTAVISVKTEPKVKEQAQKVAEKHGLTLGVLLNMYLKNLIKTKSLSFEANEEPSEYLIGLMKKAKENWKKGNVSPGFKSGKEAVKWLREQGI